MVARGKLSSTLCKTQFKLPGEEVNAPKDTTSPNLWDKRLPHLSERGMQALKLVVPFSKGTKLDPCNYCIFRKHHTISFG